MSNTESNELLNRYVAGDERAATAIFDRYLERLLAFARTRISKNLKRRVDEEDIVQSAYRSFFIHARNREYVLSRSGDLWRLLVGVTLNKLYGQIEKNTAGKRTVEREQIASFEFERLVTHEPAIVDVAAAAEQLNIVLRGLANDQRKVLLATLQGESIDLIAASIGKSTRTVRRLFAEAKRQFERQLLKKYDAKPDTPNARTQFVEPDAPLKFSDFILNQLVGAGGMGKVYQATEKSTGKSVAIKTLHKSRQKDKRAVSRFVLEAQILTQIRHPNIVGVQGLGQFPGGGYFLVMNFIEGMTLQSKLASGALPVDEAVPIMIAIANGVGHAHERGVVHCDLKPANVLFGVDGQVHVTDFGFAFVLGNSAFAIETSIGGTAGYIAPEILNSANEPSPAADLFALGVLLWRIVTGEMPNKNRLARPDTEAAKTIQAVCLRCLAPNPRDRYASATEFINALNEI